MTEFTSVDEMSDDQKYGESKWDGPSEDEYDRIDRICLDRKDNRLMDANND